MRNFIVLGVPRSGTSMCAGLLRIFGINMGTEIIPDRHEAHEFDDKTLFEMADIIHERNHNWKEDWGFKNPWIGNFLKNIFNYFANPHYIYVTRDLVASANSDMRHNPDFQKEPSKWKWVWTRNLYLINEIEKVLNLVNSPTLYISYEESLKDPEGLIDKLEKFTKIELSPEKRKEALEFIKPGYRKLNEN